jgi:hypothetical protein
MIRSPRKYMLSRAPLSDARYHKRAREGSEYVRVLVSSRIVENGITSIGSSLPEKPDAYIAGKKRTKKSNIPSNELRFATFDSSIIYLYIILYSVCLQTRSVCRQVSKLKVVVD